MVKRKFYPISRTSLRALHNGIRDPASLTEVRKHKVRIGKGSKANVRLQMFVWDNVRMVKSS